MRLSLFILAFMVMVTRVGYAQILNGNFQTPGQSNCDAGANWIVPSGTNAPQYVVEGTNSWIDITPCGGFGNGSYIEQTVSTTTGQSYYLEFDLASTYGWQIWDSGLDIFINNNPLDTGVNRVFNNTYNTSFAGAMNWKTFQSSSFIATTSSITIRLVGHGANPQNPSYSQGGTGPGVMGLDNVILKQGSLTSLSKNYRKSLDVSIAPQPVSSVFRIISTDVIHSFEIIDLTGKTLYTGEYTNPEINVSEFPSGVYFIKLNGTHLLHTQKLIIQH